MKTQHVSKIINVRNLMTRSEIDQWMISTAEEAMVIGGDYDESVKGTVIDIRGDDKLFRNASKIGRSKIYRQFHCGCVHDCCGCLCGISVDAYKNGDFITVVGRFGYNY